MVDPLSVAAAQACTVALSRGQSDHRRNGQGAVDNPNIAASGPPDVEMWRLQAAFAQRQELTESGYLRLDPPADVG